MLLAFDDTDDAEGGCTTHVVFAVLAALRDVGLRGLPRLVRLNPNIPWKTRGNAAVVLPLGRLEGPYARCGEYQGLEVRVHPEASAPPDGRAIIEAAWQAILKVARPGAAPGVVLVETAPPGWAYWQGVRSTMEIADAKGALDSLGAHYESKGDGRALIGCLAALAWPGPAWSHEFIAYRQRSRIGTERQIDTGPLRRLGGTTFHSFDAEVDRPTCIPNTPCPVLCGIRGKDPEQLREVAIETIARAAREPVDAWLLFDSNQASGDHVSPVAALADAPPMATIEVSAKVTGDPATRQGGHVFVTMEDQEGVEFEAAAFEPTGRFRDVVRSLRSGDEVIVTGALADRVVRLERIHVTRLATKSTKVANPECPQCGKSMKSRGQGAGFRCIVCGIKAPPSAAVLQEEERILRKGEYEVPVRARRHLHRH